jgi:hypothetical protein
MKKVYLLTTTFVLLCLCFFVSIGVATFQQQQQQQQNDGFGGDFTRTVTTEEYYGQTPTDSGGNSKVDSWGTPGSNTQGGYTTQKPADYGQLKDTGISPGFGGQVPQGSQPGPNGLCILDSTGLNRYPSMSLPINGYIEEELTPSMEGNLTVEELYPDGQVRTFSMGYVKPYHVYKMWFTADVPGTHKVRYSINGYHSNIVEFYVQDSSRYSSGYSSMSSSGSNGNQANDRAIALCIKRGNIYENGKCTFPGGSSCDVWDFYAGDCILSGKPRR